MRSRQPPPSVLLAVSRSKAHRIPMSTESAQTCPSSENVPQLQVCPGKIFPMAGPKLGQAGYLPNAPGRWQTASRTEPIHEQTVKWRWQHVRLPCLGVDAVHKCCRHIARTWMCKIKRLSHPQPPSASVKGRLESEGGSTGRRHLNKRPSWCRPSTRSKWTSTACSATCSAPQPPSSAPGSSECS